MFIPLVYSHHYRNLYDKNGLAAPDTCILAPSRPLVLACQHFLAKTARYSSGRIIATPPRLSSRPVLQMKGKPRRLGG